MESLHGTWINDHSDDFIQTGNFYIWIEMTEPKAITTNKRKSSKAAPASGAITKHPESLGELDLKSFLYKDLVIKDELLEEPSNKRYPKEKIIFPQYFLLPTSNNQPLPSLEAAQYLEIEIPEDFELKYW